MKVEINFKNKVRFFGQYWGQEVFVNPFLGSDPVHNVYVFEYSDPEDIGREYLLLKPISVISEQDLLELADFVEFDGELDKNWRDGINELVDHFNDMDAFLVLGDFFRYRGYALPWMGLSVEEQIEAGWIKLIEA